MRYRRDGTVLDLGCGTARNFVPPPRFEYHGVDISGEAIRAAQQSISRANARFEVADICDYEPSTVYDVIVMREVLYYLPLAAVPKIAGRMRDALAPGGMLVVQVWNRQIYGPVVDAAVKGSQLAVVEQFDRDDGGRIVVLARPT
jgi:trans-aconitate methyltransferase